MRSTVTPRSEGRFAGRWLHCVVAVLPGFYVLLEVSSRGLDPGPYPADVTMSAVVAVAVVMAALSLPSFLVGVGVAAVNSSIPGGGSVLALGWVAVCVLLCFSLPLSVFPSFTAGSVDPAILSVGTLAYLAMVAGTVLGAAVHEPRTPTR